MSEDKKAEVFSKTGTIKGKEEAMSKKGKYWKFTLDLRGEEKGLLFSLWEYSAGHDVSIGDNIKVYWTENPGTGQHGPVTYRNINSIVRNKEEPGSQGTLTESQEVVSSKQEEPVKDMQKVGDYQNNIQKNIQHGQVCNLTVDYIMHKQKLLGSTAEYKLVDKFSNVYDIINTLMTEKRKKVLGR